MNMSETILVEVGRDGVARLIWAQNIILVN
jgi:hypothetical protein